MKLIFKNKTKYTKQVYANFLQFHQNKYGIKYKFTTILTILILSFFIITNLQYSNYPTVFLVVIALVLFCLHQFFYPIKKVEKELKTEKFEKEKEVTYKFYEKFFVISEGMKTEKMKYSKLHRVFEAENFFYLYINIDHAFLLDKSTFTKGNTSEFLKFLRKKTFYKIYL